MIASAAQDDDTPRAGEPPYPAAGTVWYAIGVMTAGWIMAYLDRFIVGILLEPMRRDLHLTDTQLSLVQGFAFALFFVLAGLPIGRLVDRTNRKAILIAGVVCWSLATFACGMAQDFWHLFIARLAVGIGEACLAPASFSIIADMIPPKRRGSAMGFLVGGTAIGNAGSILLGGLLLQIFGVDGQVALPLVGTVATWQFVFFAVGAPGVLVGLSMIWMHEPVRRERAGETADGKAFLSYVRKHPAGFGLTIGAFACNMIANNSIASWIPVILMRVHKMPPAELGATIGAILLTIGAVAPPAGGALGDFLSRRFARLGRLGPLVVIYPVLAALYVGWWFNGSAAYAILAFGISGPVFGGMINGATYPALNQMVPNEMRGQTTTLYLLIASMVGIGLAPTFTALITDHVFHDPAMVRQSVVLVAFPAAVLGLLLTLLARGPYQRTVEAAQQLIEHTPPTSSGQSSSGR